MPRPQAPCAKCIKAVTKCEDHLGNTYDRLVLKGWTEQDMIEYACNRVLALDRDNGNKAEGVPASRIYKSRNETTARALANRCGAKHPNKPLHCIRNPHPHEPEAHKY